MINYNLSVFVRININYYYYYNIYGELILLCSTAAADGGDARWPSQTARQLVNALAAYARRSSNRIEKGEFFSPRS